MQEGGAGTFGRQVQLGADAGEAEDVAIVAGLDPSSRFDPLELFAGGMVISADHLGRPGAQACDGVDEDRSHQPALSAPLVLVSR